MNTSDSAFGDDSSPISALKLNECVLAKVTRYTQKGRTRRHQATSICSVLAIFESPYEEVVAGGAFYRKDERLCQDMPPIRNSSTNPKAKIVPRAYYK
jgi:hypothetical protein